MDVGAWVGGAVALVVGLLSWTQSRATNRRSDFQAITDRLDRDLAKYEKRLTLVTRGYLELQRWARLVGPNSPAGPPPEPPAELDLTHL